MLPGVSADGHRSGQGLTSLENFFSKVQADATEAVRAVRALTAALSRFEKATAGGDVTGITKSLEDIVTGRSAIDRALSELASHDISQIEATFRADRYFKEIAELASVMGLAGVRSTEGRLFSYPYVVERKKSGLAISIGSRSTKNIRPSAVVKALAEARSRRSRFEPRALLDAVESIYEVRRRSQASDLVPIEDVYDVLTALPGSERGYPFLDFLANLDEINRAKVVTSKTRRSIDLPPPSTTGKGGKAFRIIREDGREQLYHMMRFSPSALV